MAFLFQWRTAMVSEHGPASPVTRHVLLTLALHMDQSGGSCFPSTRTLASETALSRRSVESHLSMAEGEGWITRIAKRGTGQGWKRMEYKARMPENVGKEVRHVEPKGGERGSPRTHEGGEPDDIKVGKEVPLSTPKRSSVAAAVETFCAMTGMSWSLKEPLDTWADSLANDYPGVAIAYQVKKAAEYHEGNPKKYKRPDKAIRNWLEIEKAKPNKGTSSAGLSAQHVRPEELR